MRLIERFRQKRRELELEFGSARLAFLTAESLREKRDILAERLFAQRIEHALRSGEIQFASEFPLDEPEEQIATRLVQLKGFEGSGYAVYLVIKSDWVQEAFSSRDRRENRDYLYDNLKEALQLIDQLRAQGNEVLTEADCQSIVQQQKQLR